jgi:hypothetical protein
MGRHGTQLTWDLDYFADLPLDDTDTARRHRVGFVMLEFRQSNDHFSPPGCDLSRHFSWECSHFYCPSGLPIGGDDVDCESTMRQLPTVEVLPVAEIACSRAVCHALLRHS